MPQKRTSSRVIRKAAARAAGVESIDPALAFGTDLSLAGYKTAIADAQAKQSAYNTLLSQVAAARNVFEAAEAGVGDLSDRMLSAVAGKYGRNSNEYVQAGGTSKSGRKRTSANVQPAAVPPVAPSAK